jgi:hypothetical protein
MVARIPNGFDRFMQESHRDRVWALLHFATGAFIGARSLGKVPGGDDDP